METKDLIGLSFLFAATLGGVTLTCFSLRAREAAFFFMIALTAITFKLDVNFHSYYWYRGTTRGLEVSLVDVLAWCVLASSFLAPRGGGPRWYWPAGLGCMLLLFAYAALSVLFISDPKIYGLFELSKMLRGILFFLAAAWFIRGERELAFLVLALACAAGFEGIVALKQRVLGGLYRAPGTIDDPNSFSMYLCTIAPVFVAAATSTLPKWMRWFCTAAIGATTLSIVLTLSRAGIPIYAFVTLGAAAFCLSWRITFQKVAVAGLITLAIAGLVYKQWNLMAARWSGDSLAREYLGQDMPDSRGYYLRLARAIEEDRFFGVGLNNWSYWVSKKYAAEVLPYEADEDYDDLTYAPSKQLLPSFRYAAPAHNLGALTLGELGMPGLVLFAIVWLRWFHMGARFLWPRIPQAMWRVGVGIFFGSVGLFLQSLTEWTFRQTHIFLTFHAMLGALAALCCWRRELKRQQRELALPQEHWDEEREYEPVIA
jgi:hypothetical protein